MSKPLGEWQRLHSRVLLRDPLSVAKDLLVPAVFAFGGISLSKGGPPLWIAPVFLLGCVVFGVLPWLTTRWRLVEDRLEVRKGWLNRRDLSAPIDRIRSVDTESTLLLRLLGLTKVEIGTGADQSEIELDALDHRTAHELTAELSAARTRLAGGALPDGPDPIDLPDVAAAGTRPTKPGEEELARFDPRWLRYAPLNLTRLTLVAAAVTLITQLDFLIPDVAREWIARGWSYLTSLPVAVTIAVLVAAALIGWVVESTLGYLLRWGNLRVLRTADAIRIESGLATVKTTTLEQKRIRGATLGEPSLARLCGAAELHVLATGVDDGDAQALPYSPVALNRAVGGVILGTSTPLTMPLRGHGPLARRRRHLRHQWPTLPLAFVVAVAWLDFGASPWWWAAVPAYAVFGVVRAELSWRALGHELTPTYLTARSGAFSLSTTAIQTDGIVGWTVNQSFFQRRLGLATLTATMAAGSESVEIHDVPADRAWAVAHAATPRLLRDFLA